MRKGGGVRGGRAAHLALERVRERIEPRALRERCEGVHRLVCPIRRVRRTGLYFFDASRRVQTEPHGGGAAPRAKTKRGANAHATQPNATDTLDTLDTLREQQPAAGDSSCPPQIPIDLAAPCAAPCATPERKDGYVMVKELGMLKTWKSRWATFDTGTLTFYESKKSTTPISQFVLPSASVFVEPQPKEKLEKYARQQQLGVPAKYKANHFHLVFGGGRYCISCAVSADVERWYALLRKWALRVPYAPLRESACPYKPVLRARSRMFCAAGLGDGDCTECYASLRAALDASEDVRVEGVVFMNSTSDKGAADRYPTLSLAELVEVHFAPPATPDQPLEEYMSEQEASTVRLIEDLGYFCTVVV